MKIKNLIALLLILTFSLVLMSCTTQTTQKDQTAFEEPTINTDTDVSSVTGSAGENPE